MRLRQILLFGDSSCCPVATTIPQKSNFVWNEIHYKNIPHSRTLQLGDADAVILFPGREDEHDRLDLAREIRERGNCPVIFVTRICSKDLAIAALRTGVSDYLELPITREDLYASLNRCLARAEPAPPMVDCGKGDLIVGSSSAIQRIRSQISKVASTNSTVLVTGETGTGKEMVAQALHENSPRAKHTLVCVNCAAIPDSLLESELFGHERGAYTGADSRYSGRLESANGGTVVLDEIGDLTPYGQAKILRLIETKEIQRLGTSGSVRLNVRIVAATNRNLELMTDKGQFRTDLYYRLNVHRIQLPPLRDRREDVLPLFRHFLKLLRGSESTISADDLSEDFRQFLMQYDWPGNVRELRNLVEVILVGGHRGPMRCADLPERFQTWRERSTGPESGERIRILSALQETSWNKAHAAQRLHWSRMTLYRKLKRYGLRRDEAGLTA